MPLSVRSFHDLNVAIVHGLPKIRRLKFDGIVGIPRSGMAPAALISTHVQKPVADLDFFCKTGQLYGRSGHIEAAPPKRILLVDDTCNKGRAMRRATDMLRQHRPNVEFVRFAVWGPYQLPDPYREVDVYLENLHGPRCFQWNMWKHIRLPRWAFDMDGVLCRDPTKQENDDGPAYVNFLNKADPMFLPQRPIGWIITSRNEIYRSQTEAWLKKHGIQYAGLIMCPCKTKSERMRFMKQYDGGRGGWKAEQWLKLMKDDRLEYKPELFIESNAGQAKAINRLTGLLTWSTMAQQAYGEQPVYDKPE